MKFLRGKKRANSEEQYTNIERTAEKVHRDDHSDNCLFKNELKDIKRIILNKHSSKENTEIVKKHMKIWLDIREMQSKTSMKSHFTVIGMAIIKRQIIPIVGEDLEELETSYAAAGTTKWGSHFGK